MNAASLVQGSDEWKLARCGHLTSSRVSDAIARTKTGWGASRANVMAELIAERLTGTPTNGYSNAAMQWGTEQEPLARDAYAFRIDADVEQVGFLLHPTIKWSGASPDGLVGTEGLIEIKCPNTATHLDTLLGQEIEGKYITQMQWQMACTARNWCDFCSFDPRLPETMRLFVKRVHRDEKRIAELEVMVSDFLAELDGKVTALKARYQQPVNLRRDNERSDLRAIQACGQGLG